MGLNWKDAPEWAQWGARDENRFCLWFENMPTAGKNRWIYNGRSAVMWTPQEQMEFPASVWWATLEHRPPRVVVDGTLEYVESVIQIDGKWIEVRTPVYRAGADWWQIDE